MSNIPIFIDKETITKDIAISLYDKAYKDLLQQLDVLKAIYHIINACKDKLFDDSLLGQELKIKQSIMSDLFQLIESFYSTESYKSNLELLTKVVAEINAEILESEIKSNV